MRRGEQVRRKPQLFVFERSEEFCAAGASPDHLRKKDDRLKRAVFSWWSMRRGEQVRRKPQLFVFERSEEFCAAGASPDHLRKKGRPPEKDGFFMVEHAKRRAGAAQAAAVTRSACCFSFSFPLLSASIAIPLPALLTHSSEAKNFAPQAQALIISEKKDNRLKRAVFSCGKEGAGGRGQQRRSVGCGKASLCPRRRRW